MIERERERERETEREKEKEENEIEGERAKSSKYNPHYYITTINNAILTIFHHNVTLFWLLLSHIIRQRGHRYRR